MISVVVVTFNRKAWLSECLDSILYQDFDEAFEVIVVDNNSSDGTADYCNYALKDKVKYIFNDFILNLAACKELAVKSAAGEQIVFTDDDCIVAKDWLKNVRVSLSVYDLVGGVVLALPGTRFPVWWRISMDWVVGVNSAPDSHFPPLGSNIAFKRNAFLFLSEEFIPSDQFNPYGEDNARVKKSVAAGFSLGINLSMLVYHRVPDERLSVKYCIKRSYIEGLSQAAAVFELKTLLRKVAVILINPLRLLVTMDMNHIFRVTVGIGYLAGLYARILSRK